MINGREEFLSLGKRLLYWGDLSIAHQICDMLNLTTQKPKLPDYQVTEDFSDLI